MSPFAGALRGLGMRLFLQLCPQSHVNGGTCTYIIILLFICFPGGIIQHHCSDVVENLDHAVQIVGYDLTGGRLIHNCYVAIATWNSYTDQERMMASYGGSCVG